MRASGNYRYRRRPSCMICSQAAHSATSFCPAPKVRYLKASSLQNTHFRTRRNLRIQTTHRTSTSSLLDKVPEAGAFRFSKQEHSLFAKNRDVQDKEKQLSVTAELVVIPNTCHPFSPVQLPAVLGIEVHVVHSQPLDAQLFLLPTTAFCGNVREQGGSAIRKQHVACVETSHRRARCSITEWYHRTEQCEHE